MQIDPNSPVPIFEQIVNRISSAVAAGIYKPGDLIPSVRQQAIALLVNPNTVQRAYERLEREGLLVGRRGSGMEVSPQAPVVATARTVDSVQRTFVNGVETGKSAGLPRDTIDGLYHKAWNGTNQCNAQAATT